MNQLSQWITEITGLSLEVQGRIVATIVAVVALLTVRRLLRTLVENRIRTSDRRYEWRKNIGYVIWGLLIIIIGRIWLQGFQDIITYLGILSAGLAIALKDALSNLAGWFFLIWKRPFHVGDRIEIDGISGDVVDIRFFQFTIMEIGNWVDSDQPTGRLIHIPNGKLFSSPQANFTQGFMFIWDEIPILLTFESNWRKAQKLFLEIIERQTSDILQHAEAQLNDAMQQFLIFHRTIQPAVYISVEASGVQLTLRYLVGARQRRMCKNDLWEDLLTMIDDNVDLELAYPTQRFYMKETSSIRKD